MNVIEEIFQSRSCIVISTNDIRIDTTEYRSITTQYEYWHV